jgi:hypothetical protein
VNALPELSTCPHCGGQTRLDPSAQYRWVCAACGGPRIPGSTEPSKALSSARVAAMTAFGWSAGSIVLAMIGVAGGALASIVAMASGAAGATIGVVALLLFVLAWRASTSAAARRKEARSSVDDAWREAILAKLRSGGDGTTAATLAKEMRIDEAEADRLLTELSADDRVRVDVGEGHVHYRVDGPPPPLEEEREHEDENEERARGERA